MAKRGRPRGETATGRATRQRLYEVATRLFAERGYEATTMRAIATEAGVSPGLLYRYFPNKQAVVLRLYDALSQDFVDAVELPEGRWRARFELALTASLDSLRPQRSTLLSLLTVLLADPAQGLLSESMRFSRERVAAVFVEVVEGATDTPKDPATVAALARSLDAIQLAMILAWLLDRSPGQRSTWLAIRGVDTALGWLTPALRFGPTRRALDRVDRAVQEALYGEEDER